MSKKRRFLQIIAVAVVIKLALFAFTSIYAPEGKIEYDSNDYLSTGINLAKHGTFTRDYEALIATKNVNYYEFYRTPGYPLFLGIFHGLLKIPLTGIVFIQILLTLATAYITFQAAGLVDQRLEKLSAIIILFDPPITIFSLMILTESLFLVLISTFMYIYLKYLQTPNIKKCILCGLILGLATYVRPIGFFIGAGMLIFSFYLAFRKKQPKFIVHALILMLAMHSILGLWQYRNYKLFRYFALSNLNNATIGSQGLIKSYTREENPERKNLAPVPYYINVTTRSFFNLMTLPGTFKYFGIKPLTVAGKIVSYPWMVFWFIGFLAGVVRAKNDVRYHFLLFIILYFMSTSIVGAMTGVNSRFRVPMMPFVAIVAAHGWMWIRSKFKRQD